MTTVCENTKHRNKLSSIFRENESDLRVTIKSIKVERFIIDSLCLYKEQTDCHKVSLQSRLLALTLVYWESQTVRPLGKTSQTVSP